MSEKNQKGEKMTLDQAYSNCITQSWDILMASKLSLSEKLVQL